MHPELFLHPDLSLHPKHIACSVRHVPELRMYNIAQVHHSCTVVLESEAAALEAMGLTFVAVNEAVGTASEVELMPGGANRAVHVHNKGLYIALLAQHYCSRGTSLQGVSQQLARVLLGQAHVPVAAQAVTTYKSTP